MPRGRSQSGRYYRWKEIVAHLRTRPGAWLLELPDVPATVVDQVRRRRHRDLRHDDGHVEAMILNEHTTQDGQDRGDVHLKWVYTAQTDIHHKPRNGAERSHDGGT